MRTVGSIHLPRCQHDTRIRQQAGRTPSAQIRVNAQPAIRAVHRATVMAAVQRLTEVKRRLAPETLSPPPAQRHCLVTYRACTIVCCGSEGTCCPSDFICYAVNTTCTATDPSKHQYDPWHPRWNLCHGPIPLEFLPRVVNQQNMPYYSNNVGINAALCRERCSHPCIPTPYSRLPLYLTFDCSCSLSAVFAMPREPWEAQRAAISRWP